MSQGFVALITFYRSAAGKQNGKPVGAQTKKQNPTTVEPQLPIAGERRWVCRTACVWALRVVHQYISKGGILRGLYCSSLASQSHFYKMSRRAVTEIGIYQWHDLTQQESSLPGAGGVRRGPGSVASQPRLTPSHHEAPRAPSWGSAAPWWGFLPFPLCLHLFSDTLNSLE